MNNRRHGRSHLIDRRQVRVLPAAAALLHGGRRRGRCRLWVAEACHSRGADEGQRGRAQASDAPR